MAQAMLGVNSSLVVTSMIYRRVVKVRRSFSSFLKFNFEFCQKIYTESDVV